MDVVRLARAFAFGAPLAFLLAAFVGPPDPFTQLGLLGVGLVLFVPAAYASVAASGDSRTLVAFYTVILVTTILGALLVAATNGGLGLRLGVIVVAVAAGAATVLRLE